MKKILTLIFLIPLIIFSQEEDDRWKALTFSSENFFLYDTKSIKISGAKIRVWIRIIPFPWMKDEVIKKKKDGATFFKKDKYDKYSHTMNYFEFDCSNYCIRTLQTIDYNTDGELIESYNFKNSTCDELIPESIGEELFYNICELRKNYLKGNK